MTEDRYDENVDDDNVAYGMTPEFAHMLETLSLAELRELIDDEHLVLARFVEGRERRELPAPNLDEVAVIHSWHAKAMLDQVLIGLVIKGMVYVDIDPDGEPVFEATYKGRQVVEDSFDDLLRPEE